MNIFKLRVIIDTEEDVFRDIEIDTQASFEQFHQCILKAFDWEEGEMASFYTSNDKWEKGTEIPLMDMGLKTEDGKEFSMRAVKLEDLIHQPDEKLIYVYDFLRMWCFYIELQEFKKAVPGTLYPSLVMVFGDAPTMDSKELDLFDEVLPAEDDSKSSKPELTGDPEIDQYLQESSESEPDEDNFESLDDLDEHI
jgi:hypothetical protein